MHIHLKVAAGGVAAATLLLGFQVALADKGGIPHVVVNHKAVCDSPKGNDDVYCHSRVVTDGAGNVVTNTVPTGYGPAQFQSAYGALTAQSSTWTWNGKTIGIVDAYDDPRAESDLAAYSTQFGLPPCTTSNGCFKKVGQNGSTRLPRGNQGWGLEISLDVQAAHAMCPGCKILLVEASTNSFSNLLAAEDYATSHATVVSNSWGGNEFSSETSNTYDAHFNKPGVPITVSSGDSGFGVEYPAASQYVTAVGGTTLDLNADNTRASESVWNGSGSGCSSYENKPSWQTDTTGCGKRSVADVSADADPATGAAVYDSYGYAGQSGWFQVGGTSLASPLIASIYALAGNANTTTYGSYPYAHTASLYDVVSGQNANSCSSYLCMGVGGYDGPSGLGTPNGTSAF